MPLLLLKFSIFLARAPSIGEGCATNNSLSAEWSCELVMINSTPFFSVVIPLHNKEKYVGEALKGLLLQEYEDFEVLIVDDASQDGGVNVAASFDDGRISLLHRESPGPGGYEARNLGIAHSRGEWLVFFDADDKIEPSHLRKFYENIIRYPSLDVFVNSYKKIKDGRVLDRPVPFHDGVIPRSAVLRKMIDMDFICMNSVCVKKSFFRRLGCFPEGRFKRGGDVYTWVKLAVLSERLYFDSAVTSYWLVDNSSVTKEKKNIDQREPLVDLVEELEKGENICTSEVKKICNRKVIFGIIAKKHGKVPYMSDYTHVYYRLLTFRQATVLMATLLPRFFIDAIRFIKAFAGLDRGGR